MALTFEYKVRDQAGKVIEGSLDGDSVGLVVRRLREQGYLPISVKPRTKRELALKADIAIPGLDRIKGAEIAMATRQLASMVQSGLPLVRALTVMTSQIENKKLAKVFEEVRLDAESGTPFSRALAKHPKVFDHLFTSMIQAAEAAGTLDVVLPSLASTIEKKVAINRKIKSAMTYPAVVLCVMIIIFLAMLVFIVPVFKKIFASLGGAKLPAPTLAVLKISSIIASLWSLVIIAVIIGLIIGFVKWKASDSGRRVWDRLKLHFPVFGPLMHKVSMTRFTSSLAALVASGVPMLQSLDIVSDTSGNQIVADVLQEAKEAVRQGRALAEPLGRHPEVIPFLVTQMVDVGEQTGALDAMLLKVAQFYDEEVEATVNSLSSLLEPLLTVVMGIMVGLMVVSLYLPMFKYVQHVPTQ